MNERLSSWHCDCTLQYDCVCLPVAIEEENTLPISAVGLAKLVGQAAPHRHRSLQFSDILHFTLRFAFCVIFKTEKKISKKLFLMPLRAAKGKVFLVQLPHQSSNKEKRLSISHSVFYKLSHTYTTSHLCKGSLTVLYAYLQKHDFFLHTSPHSLHPGFVFMCLPIRSYS